MIVDEDQNTQKNGYGEDSSDNIKKSWAALYGLSHFPTFEEARKISDAEKASKALRPRFVELQRGYKKRYFDTLVFSARVRLTAELFLMEANSRAKEQGKKAFCHVVGLGLGVWAVDGCQKHLMVEAYADVMRSLKLNFVGYVNFSWFNGVQNCGGVRNGEMFTENDNKIIIYFNQRDPADSLKNIISDEVEDILLVAIIAYAYYYGKGDPAAACCSNIPELQNPDVNLEAFTGENIAVHGY
eukprot:UC4_evm1s788